MHEPIISFIRETLGCGCPDEVFEHIDCSEDVTTDTGISIDYRINVGNRLLVYIVEGNGFRQDYDPWNEKKLKNIVDAGKEERDREGFNRFRLVLAIRGGRTDEGIGTGIVSDSSANAAAASAATRIFDSLDFVDDRIHLHVIPADDISFLQGNP